MQVSKETFDALLSVIDQEKAERASSMPDEHAALMVLFSAYRRLIDIGWRNGIYAPRDGTTFQTIELGSTGIHDCSFDGTYFNFCDGGDIYPSSSKPHMFRLYPADQAKADAKMKAAADRLRQDRVIDNLTKAGKL